MTINSPNFLYANESSEKYGVILCSIGTDNTDTNDEESNDLLSTTPYKDTWDFHGIEKTSPLKFKITIAKCDGTYFDSYEVIAIRKWLCKKKRDWLQVYQSDLSDIYYYCSLTNPRPVSIGMRSAGLEFDVTCDAPYAWSKLYEKTYTSTSSAQLQLNLFSGFDEYITHPILTITATGAGEISITNTTINKVLTIKECTTNEVIYLDCRNYKIKSSNGRVLLDNWNKNILDLVDGVNNITLTGKFTLKIQYRTPKRIGG